MWYAIIGSLIGATAIGLIYVSFRAANFEFVKKAAGGRRWAARVLCFAFFNVLTAVLWLWLNMMNALVCVVHLLVFWVISDAVSFVVSAIRRKKPARYRAGAVAAVLCAVYLAGGWYADHHVRVQRYELTSDKLAGDLRIVQISDSHIGATFDADGFGKYVDEINLLSPDVAVITGDFVDDDTSREDMIGGCAALGRLRTRYGVYFVYGNHDRGLYGDEKRGWSKAELEENLRLNGVTVLKDEAVSVGGRFNVVGRKDRSDGLYGEPRLSAPMLMQGVDTEKYTVILDHQPYDFDGEAAVGADLVLCGHTHGGQFIPIRNVGVWTGQNALRYGHERRLDTDFIVSSGISNWTFKFKTGCSSEYVVVDVSGTEG